MPYLSGKERKKKTFVHSVCFDPIFIIFSRSEFLCFYVLTPKASAIPPPPLPRPPPHPPPPPTNTATKTTIPALMSHESVHCGLVVVVMWHVAQPLSCIQASYKQSTFLFHHHTSITPNLTLHPT